MADVYAPTTWSTGDVITAGKLNNLETQYGDVSGGRRILPDYDWAATALGLKGVYTVVTYSRTDATTYMVSTLSNPDVNNNYQTDTWQFHDPTGTSVTETHIWTLTYDASSVLTQAVMA